VCAYLLVAEDNSAQAEGLRRAWLPTATTRLSCMTAWPCSSRYDAVPRTCWDRLRKFAYVQCPLRADAVPAVADEAGAWALHQGPHVLAVIRESDPSVLSR
jgi:hypothetical protein